MRGMRLCIMFVEKDNINMWNQLDQAHSVYQHCATKEAEIHTASTPCLPFRPTSTLKTQWLLHLRSRASPSSPRILLSVVFTDRPSTCIQSNGAGLLTLGRI